MRLRYGVGMRVFTDRRLLGQIRSEIVRNSMRPEEVAPLENVTPEVLIALLEERAEPTEDSSVLLRQFAVSRAGFQVIAWRTTRGHCSKLHIIDADGVVLCGTPSGAERAAIHSGACVTCTAHARLELAASARAARMRGRSGQRAVAEGLGEVAAVVRAAPP
jgi:hypothetical protein